jgi:alkylation response protein AidB-like acyl-CoA dehydrogenase
VAALRTTARRDGDDYIVNGEKTFITSGMRADFLTVAVRTDPANKGPGGVSLLLVVPGDTPGLQRTLLAKMGWWASDTAHLRFDSVPRAGANLLGEEGAGLQGHHGQLQPRAADDGGDGGWPTPRPAPTRRRLGAPAQDLRRRRWSSTR